MSARPEGPVPVVPPRVDALLQEWLRSRKTEHGLRERILFVLGCAAEESAASIARRLQVDSQRVRRWRVRWVAQHDKLESILSDSKTTEEDLRHYLRQVLKDEPRPGVTPKFSAQEVASIIALACQDPQQLGLPISHWSARDLREEALRQGLVSSISVRQVGRFFKRCPVTTT
jgi:putative transposase